MRIIALDTETTGLYPEKGDKITEIAGIEIINRQITKNIFHTYVNPEREVGLKAKQLTGLKIKFLKNKPKFKEIADKFVDFIKGCDKIVIHNADFDINFINTELKNINFPIKDIEKEFNIIDTLKFARTIYPGKKNSIDALCERYKIKHNRKLHGALIDAVLLAKIFLNLTTGQNIIELTTKYEKKNIDIKKKTSLIKIKQEEIDLHNKYISIIKNIKL